MARSVYVTAMEPGSGKSVVTLGLMEMLSARVERLGFYRPMVASATELDPQIELVRRRYRLDASYEEMHALSDEEGQAAIASGVFGQIEKQVVSGFRTLEDRCDVVICEGTDFAGSTPAVELDLNAGLANDLGCPVLVVVRGGTVNDTVKAVRVARETLEQKGCDLFGVIASRVPPEMVAEVAQALEGRDDDRPIYVIPEQADLARPTMADVAAALGARPLFGDASSFHRQVGDVRIAAMSVEHFIDDLVEGTLVIVPGDRPDIVVASLASTLSADLPAVAGIVLTAGYELGPNARRLLEGSPFPVLEVPDRTYAVASAVHSARSVITPGDEHKIAAAVAVFESSVDTAELEERLAVERPSRMTPVMFEYELVERARADRKHIVLPEGDDDRILRAADILLRRGVVDLTILGDVDDIRSRAAGLGLDLSGADLVEPAASPLRAGFAATYHELRKHKGVTDELALETMADESYFGTMMVKAGKADGMVSGAAHTTGDTIRPAFEIVKARKDVSVVSSVFLMSMADRVLVYGDCAVNPKPDTEQLADIAISSAETAATFGVEPRIAMLSYSTGQSAKGADVDAVRDATGIVRERRPDLKVEGPIQYDAAVDATVASLKLPESDVAGQATVFIFPDLDTGNIAYKAVQRSSGAVAIGPVLQGLNSPVNDLSRGCQVPDIVSTVVITAIQAQEAGSKE